ncbi:ASCH domain-containing protein [Lewinella sp. JB7]|uniref:ASCH domain-containing protein n=1 Tax=Lewinella sp. JB7 TaxID=2962887 RepID=UPI0020C9606B|nr:ASCH domain-containing protein [Lewinella sp. JB7]MCP9237951.1 ASCH domain-containing protein [Lewinella sp. JB7]
MKEALLISVKPQYVDRILDGTKTIELRKVKPRQADVQLVIIYCTYPNKEVACICKIEEILEMNPTDLWNNYNDWLGIEKASFFDYYQKSTKAVGIKIKDVVALPRELSLDEVRRRLPGFSPPQTYQYVSYKTLHACFADYSTHFIKNAPNTAPSSSRR